MTHGFARPTTVNPPPVASGGYLWEWITRVKSFEANNIVQLENAINAWLGLLPVNYESPAVQSMIFITDTPTAKPRVMVTWGYFTRVNAS